MLSRRSRLRFFVCSLVSLFSANLVLGAEDAGNVTVFSGARLLDGSGRPPLDQSVLVITGDKITAVGPPNAVKYPADAKVIDVSGKTIVPGIISDDSHVGLVDGTSIKPENYNRENILRQLRQYERYGVTTVMSLGLNGDLFYQLRDEQHVGKNPGADLFGADRGIGAPLGGPPAPTLPVGNDQLYRPQTPEEAQADVREMAARHPDLIKIWVDDLLGTAPKIKPEIYWAAIRAAHGAGLRVACHIYDLDDAKAVIQAGADIIAHGVCDQPVDAQFVGLLKSASVWYIAALNLDETFYIYAEQPEWTRSAFFQAALQPALQHELSDPDYLQRMLTNPRVPIFKKAVATNEANLKKLYQAGVQIGFGTDSGALPLRIPGFAEHRELQLMVASGLSPAQALECATGHAAALLGLKDRGTLEAGKLADFIILDANPLEDITNSERISAVWHRGKEVSGAITPSP